MMTSVSKATTGVNQAPIRTRAGSALLMLSKISALVLVLLLSAGICAAQEQEPSASDRPLSKVAREKSVRKAKVVITDDDMPSHPQPVSEVSATARLDAGAAEKDGAKKDEAAKQAPRQTTVPTTLSQPVELDQAQQLVEQLKQQEQMLIHSYDEMERKLAEADTESRRRIFSESLANRDLSLARKRKQIEEAERALQRIDKAGPPQGETSNEAK